ncbi:hypothetical protein FISHEDRAFT_44349 [Fistulina hepatica ATCC 64428]|uniref:EthD domain-containing protein n=1 Tax=Fistulina hepatica ATCC 64428 TaxID=1128425 RepID=A0A0D7AA65_9AGAR|nr:hypothetical protein FISHEDRAFT_44349 [Fistulina hepatica ATCC 64428]
METSDQTQMTSLVLVFADCGSAISEDRFNKWYCEEHAPARLTIPGFLSATRYKATDGQKAAWLTAYDIASPDVADCDLYKQLMTNASDNEKEILAKMEFLNRRVYEPISVLAHSHAQPSLLPGKYLLVVSMKIPDAAVPAFHKWYEEEHMVLLSKVPGWLRGRRYKLLSSTIRQPEKQMEVYKYLAVHEFDHDGYMDTPEFQHAVGTPWRAEVVKNVIAREFRNFELTTDFGKSKSSVN